MTNKEFTLDPDDWSSVQTLSHRIVDDAIAYLDGVRDRPVWQAMPDETQLFFATPLPEEPTPLEAVYDSLAQHMYPHPMGNVHPRFWMWFMGSGNFTGALGDFMAAILASNVGGGNHAASMIDVQVVDWCKSMVGFPSSASGTLVSGGSMANLVGLTIARNVKAGVDVREHGVSAMTKRLRFYASDQVHSCHRKAVEVLGLGNTALQRIATNDDLSINLDALRAAIARDRTQGLEPACIIASAGAVNTGALDDLHALADIAHEQGLWFHVDGCIGALLAIAPDNAHRVAGIERADSLAMDPHKWLHAPFDVGCALVKDAHAHHNAFAVTPEYLEKTQRGVASAHWLHEFGLQTSRGFRALKVWMALKEHGVKKFGQLIDQNIEQARYLTDLIKAEPRLELVAPTSINIVCYRYNPGGLTPEALKELNLEIMLRMQEDGTAAVSDTTVHGEHCLRAAITNHRTRREDLDTLVRETLRLARELQATNTGPDHCP